jgi:aspartyl-tRNA(Asn)/glutamyl-tRNA(Gln) amidotransferase subunit C
MKGKKERESGRAGESNLLLSFILHPSSFILYLAMPITQIEVEKIAELAHLELTAEEKHSFSVQLAAIVEYIDQLNELDTSTVNPWQQRGAGGVINSDATREDVVEPSLGQEKALDQAPDHDDGHFLVPRVIGG